MKPKVTPGPYFVGDRGYGYHVTGRGGVTIAWMSTAFTTGGGDSHGITLDEAKANAICVAEALRSAESKTTK